MQSDRINIWWLTLVFVISAAIPLLVCLGIDALFPSSLSMLMVAAIVSIPIVAFAVSRAVLAEMGRVIQLVAPAEADESEDKTERHDQPVVLDQLHPEEADHSRV